MTARVMLDLEQDQSPDGEWLVELVEWDLSHLTGWHAHLRCLSLVVMVAAHHRAAGEHGPTSWPTLDDLAWHLVSPGGANGHTAVGSEIRQLLAVAVAAGWLRYADDETGQ